MRRPFGEYGLFLVMLLAVVPFLNYMFGEGGFLSKGQMGSVAPVQTTESTVNFDNMNNLYNIESPELIITTQKRKSDEMFKLYDMVTVAKDAAGNDLKDRVEITEMIHTGIFNVTDDVTGTEEKKAVETVIEVSCYNLTTVTPDYVMQDTKGDFVNTNGKGIYKVTFKVTDTNGFSSSVTKNVLVD